jgi:hypothetical protein
MRERFRYRNTERENRFWRKGEERRCRMCNEERERDNRAHVEWVAKWYNLPTKGSFTSSRPLEQKGQKRKRKGWGIEKNIYIFLIVFFILDKTVIRNPIGQRKHY